MNKSQLKYRDEATGKLHAIIKRTVKGDLKILFSEVPVRGQ